MSMFCGVFNPLSWWATPKKKVGAFEAIKDTFKTLADIENALRKNGLETTQLIIGIDFTRSNEHNGIISNNGQCLHNTLPNALNPYQKAIDIIGRTLENFDDDHQIPVFGFGDHNTTDKSVFNLDREGRPCFGLSEVLVKYIQVVPFISLSGPTSFAPIIRKAIEIVKYEKQYHILLILTDGEIDTPGETKRAIIEASNYPLSIVAVGIGDANFDTMEEFDDGLPQRRFDNFQFVPFNKTVNDPKVENRDVAFAVAALQEIPEQM